MASLRTRRANDTKAAGRHVPHGSGDLGMDEGAGPVHEVREHLVVHPRRNRPAPEARGRAAVGVDRGPAAKGIVRTSMGRVRPDRPTLAPVRPTETIRREGYTPPSRRKVAGGHLVGDEMQVCHLRRPPVRMRRPIRPHVAPINPHAVQTILPHSEHTRVSSGSQSAFMTTLWLHQLEAQKMRRSWQPCPPNVTERDGLESLALTWRHVANRSRAPAGRSEWLVPDQINVA